MSKNSESSLLLSPFPSSYIPPQGSKMKSKASTFLKQAFSFLATMVKAKSMVAKSKRSAIKARLLIFSLLRNKKVLISAINHRIHALIGQEMAENVRNEDDSGKAIVVYDNAAKSPFPNTAHLEAEEEDDDDDDDYPDLRHSLFDLEDVDDVDEDDELVNGTGSVIDLVRNAREDGTEFILEDEIDHVADVFIRRFHRQMKIQKQESFKRYREMLARGV